MLDPRRLLLWILVPAIIASDVSNASGPVGPTGPRRFDRLPLIHPREAFPPGLIDLLLTAESAEPVLFHTKYVSGVRTRNDWPDPEYGPCITGPALAKIVDAILDPARYWWGTDYTFIYPRSRRERLMPRFALVFRRGTDEAVLTTHPLFLRFSFVEPDVWRSATGALFDAWALVNLARWAFPEEPWSSFGATNNWRPSQEWLPAGMNARDWRPED